MLRLRQFGFAALTASLVTVLCGCENPYPPRPQQWATPPVQVHQPRAELPPATDEGTGPDGSLLASFNERSARDDGELDTWMLPFQAKTMIVELLISAAEDDAERVKLLLTDNARWGTPDRREPQARPIITKQDPNGVEFLTAFRQATSRFSAKASFSCIPLQPGWQMYATSGAEPVWCAYTSGDGLDIIGVRLIVERGRVKTDYIGFFTERQTGAIRLHDAGDPPPSTPYLKHPVSLKLPELMPDGSNPVLEKPKPAPRRPRPVSAPPAAPPAAPADEPIPVEAK